jgi:hypothetical protein
MRIIMRDALQRIDALNLHEPDCFSDAVARTGHPSLRKSRSFVEGHKEPLRGGGLDERPGLLCWEPCPVRPVDVLAC